MFLSALEEAGVPKDDPAVQKALKFVSRCQNLPGETNDQPFAKKTSEDDKGGLTYTPLDPDDSRHKTPDGGLRSLGGMTYAGLKSFLYAGVSKDDPRVKSAVAWIRRHYTLEENPGMGKAGLYYYYHTFAKAMDALGEDQFADANGKKHDWRKELFDTLKSKQRADGSWINDERDPFGEGDPNLATGFALLSLSYTQPKK
jgi:squalene-hopene/tetraprenyl-beta-curcumene cyclase